MKCRKCNRSAHEIGGYLTRVNEKGVTGVWECRPNCEADLPQDTRLLLAIEGEPEATNEEFISEESKHGQE